MAHITLSFKTVGRLLNINLMNSKQMYQCDPQRVSVYIVRIKAIGENRSY